MTGLAAGLRRAIVAAGVLGAFVAPSAAGAVEPPIPEEGWEFSKEWAHVSDGYTADTQADVEEILADSFPAWSFTSWGDFLRAQNSMDNGLVQRKFTGSFTVAETGEGVQAEVYLPGGWDPGIDYYAGGNFDDRHWLHCPMDTAQGPECVEGDFGDGTTWAYVADETEVNAAVFFADGSASRLWWGADWSGPEPAPLEVKPDQVVKAAYGFSTAAIWQALRDEWCPPGRICTT